MKKYSQNQSEICFRIMVAEPDREIQNIYKSFLRGIPAVVVESGETCLELFLDPKNRFDVVIIDSHLRDYDAVETISKIKEAAPN